MPLWENLEETQAAMTEAFRSRMEALFSLLEELSEEEKDKIRANWVKLGESVAATLPPVLTHIENTGYLHFPGRLGTKDVDEAALAANKVLAVKTDESGLEYQAPGGGAGQSELQIVFLSHGGTTYISASANNGSPALANYQTWFFGWDADRLNAVFGEGGWQISMVAPLGSWAEGKTYNAQLVDVLTSAVLGTVSQALENTGSTNLIMYRLTFAGGAGMPAGGKVTCRFQHWYTGGSAGYYFGDIAVFASRIA